MGFQNNVYASFDTGNHHLAISRWQRVTLSNFLFIAFMVPWNACANWSSCDWQSVTLRLPQPFHRCWLAFIIIEIMKICMVLVVCLFLSGMKYVPTKPGRMLQGSETLFCPLSSIPHCWGQVMLNTAVFLSLNICNEVLHKKLYGFFVQWLLIALFCPKKLLLHDYKVTNLTIKLKKSTTSKLLHKAVS